MLKARRRGTRADTLRKQTSANLADMAERCTNCGAPIPVVGYGGKPLDVDECPNCKAEHPLKTPGSAIAAVIAILSGYFLLTWLTG
jgi:hypothetical protein